MDALNPKHTGDSESAKPHRRRPRYSGTNPRAFHLKYKELNPEKYPATVEKVLASGKTPAGTHRAIMVDEVLAVLQPRLGHIAVDATLGYGGHAREILRRILPGGRLIGLDTDPIELPKTEARLRAQFSLNASSPIEASPHPDPLPGGEGSHSAAAGPEEAFGPEALTIVHSNFAGLARALATQGIEGADIILADLGLSSMQIDNPERGFTYKVDGPLDLRMNPNKGRSAAEFLARAEARKLADLLRDNADEPRAEALADAIVNARSQRPMLTTRDLRTIVESALPSPRESEITLRRVFQALRIEVNDEFGALETFLRFLPSCLKVGGRVAILTFHSGEDRRVKRFFEEGFRTGVYRDISREVIRPGAAEVRGNPRSAPAKLRWAERTHPKLP